MRTYNHSVGCTILPHKRMNTRISGLRSKPTSFTFRTQTHPQTKSSRSKAPRTPPGEEVAEPQAAGGGQKKGDKTPGGGGANLKGDRSRLLRDVRVDTRSRAAWARILHEHPNARKYKGGNKKGLSKGCFGLKLDRIGSMSGLGC
ncbi:C-type natriuretic peptide precursor [Camelus ferus]|nr:C-type natriuretic peptide precursor [Camelus ferus]